MGGETKIWYLAQSGQAQGPFSEDEVKSKLLKKESSYSDLIFRHGFSKWVTIAECMEFERRAEPYSDLNTKTNFPVPMNSDSDGWLILEKDKSGEESQFIQTGPFNLETVQSKIDSGELDFSRFVWKKGMSSWMPIGSLPDFDRRKMPAFESPVKPEFSNEAAKAFTEPPRDPLQTNLPNPTPKIQTNTQFPEALLTEIEFGGPESVVHKSEPVALPNFTLSEFEMNSTKAQPVEAGMFTLQDKTEISIPSAIKLDESISKIQIEAPKPEMSSKPQVDEITKTGAELPIAEAQSKPPRVSFRIVATVVVGLTVGIVVTYSGIYAFKEYSKKSSNVPSMAQNQAVSPVGPPPVPANIQPQNPPPAPAQVEMAKNSQKLEEKKAAVTEPKILKVVVLKETSTQPQLVFEHDLPAKTEIRVLITAEAGSILKYPSYRLEKKLIVEPGVKATLELAKENLPPGDYKVQAQGGNLLATTPLALGVRNDDFRKRLAQFKKSLDKQKTNEMLTLEKGSIAISRSFATINKDFKKARNVANKSAGKKKWGEIYKKWRKDFDKQTPWSKKISNDQKSTYFFPDQLLRLKELKTQVDGIAKSMDQVIKASRKTASDFDQKLENVRVEIKEFVREVKQMR